jgi:hypothetical protein
MAAGMQQHDIAFRQRIEFFQQAAKRTPLVLSSNQG